MLNAAALAQYWSSGKERSVALWADSSYGPLESVDVLKLAKELEFPLSSFTCSFGAGLTVKGDFHDPAGKPADIVFIEMGYNDEGGIAPAEAGRRMRLRKWYTVLRDATSQVKFVIFVEQPTYKQTTPPKKKKKRPLPAWTPGAAVEGSKWTREAMALVEELGLQPLCLQVPAEELFEGMLATDAAGVVWQTGGRSYTEAGVDYAEGGELAMWEDSWHPTAAGAATHLRCLVKTFRRRFESSSVLAGAPPPGLGGARSPEGTARGRSRSRSREGGQQRPRPG